MKKVICCPESTIPDILEEEAKYFMLYSVSKNPLIGHIAPRLLKDIEKNGLNPSTEIIDFTTFALSVSAADEAIIRSDSSDGWTRNIELHVYLQKPSLWVEKRNELENTLRFLTGDFWSLHFYESDPIVLKPKVLKYPMQGDCVCLLSGGVDSLVGAIDLKSMNKTPIFVSRIARGDRITQKKYALALDGGDRHCQWSAKIRHRGNTEKSTRARSIIFFAFALIASSVITQTENRSTNIYVPENGFISLNIPLGPMRLGSLSTKTTHPIYMSGLQLMWKHLGLNVNLVLPYQFKTKGEMLKECSDKELLEKLINDSVSCGKYQRHNLTHCGVCVPCLVRRAAFHKSGLADSTFKGYIYTQITSVDSKDVSSVASTYLKYINDGIKQLTTGHLFFSEINERNHFENVISRGLDELGEFIKLQGVI
ncbi:MAG: hypothetical protein FD141_729 [Fusobacteria bacterium]|nr:MAG: hypothetical protein FD141_729 [Fusobacteriota bacterium]KAF0228605.1 MAG: hypothetical protein FD182_861 [Fusobacteriota bacterium]